MNRRPHFAVLSDRTVGVHTGLKIARKVGKRPDQYLSMSRSANKVLQENMNKTMSSNIFLII